MQPNENLPFIEEILNNISSIICDLQPHQVGPISIAMGSKLVGHFSNIDSIFQLLEFASNIN